MDACWGCELVKFVSLKFRKFREGAWGIVLTSKFECAVLVMDQFDNLFIAKQLVQ